MHKCHSDHKGKDYKLISLDEKTFNHDLTGYQLKDRHASVDCKKCHKKEGEFTDLSQDCASCHEDRHKGQLNNDCSRCHSFKGWKDLERFNHDRDSKYPLQGKHEGVKCDKCHPNARYKVSRFNECITCHKDPHADKPVCSECHTPEGWKKIKMDHSKTKYPLIGKHLDVSCEKCHRKGQLTGLPVENCNSGFCHEDPHKDQFKDRRCESCHNVKGWKPSLSSHSANEYRGFKLDGKHSTVKCEKCHISGHYKPIDHRHCDTAGCHTDEHKGQFHGKQCESCHTAEGWKPSTFSHSSPGYKGFKLIGKHSTVKCEKCHSGGRYNPVKYDRCNSPDCHQDIHKGKFAGVTCESCHTPNGWKPSTYDHPDGYTELPKGRRGKIPCRKCHDDENIGLHGGGIPGAP